MSKKQRKILYAVKTEYPISFRKQGRDVGLKKKELEPMVDKLEDMELLYINVNDKISISALGFEYADRVSDLNT